jgi:hypothetical protein
VLRVRHRRRPVAAPDEGDVLCDPDPVRRVAGAAGANQAERRGELGRRLGFQPEHRPIEQRGLVEVVERRGQRHVVDAGKRSVRRPERPGRREVGQPARPSVGVGGDEEHGGAVRRCDRGQVGLVVAAAARQDRGE